MSADELRAAIQERGVKTQVVTNWAKGGRPIPVARYPLCASVIGHGLTVDELHGRVAAGGVKEPSVLYANSDTEAKLLAAEISQLDPAMREFVTTMINVLVAKQIRNKRKSSSKASSSRTTADA